MKTKSAFLGVWLISLSMGSLPSADASVGNKSVDQAEAKGIPAYAVKLSTRLVTSNLTATEIRGPYPNGRKMRYPREELGLRMLSEVVKADLDADSMLWILWDFAYEARSEPAWASELRRVIPSLSILPESYRNSILDHLNGHSNLSVQSKPIQIYDERPSLKKAFEEAKRVASYIPKIFPLRRALVGAIETLEKHLIGNIREGDCYDYDPSCQFGSNRGLISTFSERVAEDHDLALSVLRFALRIRQEDYRNPHPGKFQTDDQARVNIWPIALEASNQDVDRALETIAVFGHDVCCNQLYAKTREDRFMIAFLNHSAPNVGGDYNPVSNLFAPGALNGAQVPDSVLKRIHSAIRNYNEVFGETITLRAGYYHLYGGMASARALLSKGYGSESGLRLATLFPQALGHFYKRLQLTRYLSEDSIEVWKLSGEDPQKVRSSVPKGWDEGRKKQVLAELELHLGILEYTEEQHRAGALFAFKVYKKAY